MTNLTEARQTPRFGKLRDRRYDRGDFVFALADPPVGHRRPKSAPVPPAAPTELVFWRSIEKTEDPAAFDAYLRRYPKGAFAAIARLKRKRLLDRLGKAVRPPASATPAQKRRLSPEEVTRRSIQHSTAAEDFEIYLERYPNGRYAVQARERLRAAKDKN